MDSKINKMKNSFLNEINFRKINLISSLKIVSKRGKYVKCLS